MKFFTCILVIISINITCFYLFYLFVFSNYNWKYSKGCYWCDRDLSEVKEEKYCNIIEIECEKTEVESNKEEKDS